jgi:hypothetical protein
MESSFKAGLKEMVQGERRKSLAVTDFHQLVSRVNLTYDLDKIVPEEMDILSTRNPSDVHSSTTRMGSMNALEKMKNFNATTQRRLSLGASDLMKTLGILSAGKKKPVSADELAEEEENMKSTFVTIDEDEEGEKEGQRTFKWPKVLTIKAKSSLKLSEQDEGLGSGTVKKSQLLAPEESFLKRASSLLGFGGNMGRSSSVLNLGDDLQNKHSQSNNNSLNNSKSKSKSITFQSSSQEINKQPSKTDLSRTEPSTSKQLITPINPFEQTKIPKRGTLPPLQIQKASDDNDKEKEEDDDFFAADDFKKIKAFGGSSATRQAKAERKSSKTSSMKSKFEIPMTPSTPSAHVRPSAITISETDEDDPTTTTTTTSPATSTTTGTDGFRQRAASLDPESPVMEIIEKMKLALSGKIVVNMNSVNSFKSFDKVAKVLERLDVAENAEIAVSLFIFIFFNVVSNFNYIEIVG